MRNLGRVPPALLADSPAGVIQFVPHSLKDVRAKDNFANTARLICVGYEVTAAVLVLEAWMKMAKPGETLDMTEAPSEAFDRREVVVLTGETVQDCKQMLDRSGQDGCAFAARAGPFDGLRSDPAQAIPGHPESAQRRPSRAAQQPFDVLL